MSQAFSPTDVLEEIYDISSKKDIAESGGAHNQKGIEYQKHWAVMKMFELQAAGTTDFLFLFEVVQDIAIVDSEVTPSEIAIFQVKKKDRKEWSWADLTSLQAMAKPTKSPSKRKASPPKAKKTAPKDIRSSPIGKLYFAVSAVTNFRAAVASFPTQVATLRSPRAETSRPRCRHV